MKLRTEFVLDILVLSPLHIGAGNVLQKDFDYVVHENWTLRIHEERALEVIASRGEAFAQLTQGVPLGEILGRELCPDSPLVRYALSGKPENTQEIRECIKDAFDRPYIPGSSLKGALRTVLLWKVWTTRKMSLSRVKLEQNARFAARPLEKEVFGPTPHSDLLRALRLRDSSPAEKDNLAVVNVVCLSRATRHGIPIALEAIKSGTRLEVEGYFDETAFKPWGEWQKGGFLPADKRAWLDWNYIGQAARERAKARIERDRKWAQEMGLNVKLLEMIYEKLQKEDRRGFPLQIGYGTGWLGTTLGPALLEDPGFPKIHGRFELGKKPRPRGQTPPQSFPASRRLARLKDGLYPLGWAWVVPKEV